jgi:endo-1,4-beta-mannosidase
MTTSLLIKIQELLSKVTFHVTRMQIDKSMTICSLSLSLSLSFSDWISFLLNRQNSETKIAYKDDPTIMAWELASSLSCKGEKLPSSTSCVTATLVNWILEMSTYIKQIDPNHLVAVGDEGTEIEV